MILNAVVGLMVSVSAQAKDSDSSSKTLEKVVCVSSQTLGVRSRNLKNVMFSAENGERVNVFQGWGENKRTKKIRGVRYTFVRVQFPDLAAKGEDSVGWVAEEYIRTKDKCATAQLPEEETRSTVKTATENKKEDVKEASASPAASSASVSGLKDSDCCVFPLNSHPGESYLSGMRMFGARRSKGRRTHAACDLYQYKNAPLTAIADGRISNLGVYRFYQGTFAMELKLKDGAIARYGEITGYQNPQVFAARINGKSNPNYMKVAAGQTNIAKMGKVNSNCCTPMLHFEMYSGKGRGNLTTGGNKYLRRSDLINPTAYLQRWEAKTFDVATAPKD